MTPEILGQVTCPTGALVVRSLDGRNAPGSDVLDGLPPDRALTVLATSWSQGEQAGRWREVRLEVRPGTPVSRREKAGTLEAVRLVLGDARTLDGWRPGASLDGRADLVCWGRDAPTMAAWTEAERLGSGEFGWTDLSVDEADERRESLERLAADHGFVMNVELRPHSHAFWLREELRASATSAASMEVEGVVVCALETPWRRVQVARELGEDGGLVGLRLSAEVAE